MYYSLWQVRKTNIQGNFGIPIKVFDNNRYFLELFGSEDLAVDFTPNSLFSPFGCSDKSFLETV